MAKLFTHQGVALPIGIVNTLPHGCEHAVHHRDYTKSEEHGWVYGNSDLLTPRDQTALEAMLLKHKGEFAYDLKDLTGYHGTAAPLDFEMTGVPKWAGKRRHAPDDLEFLDKVASEQRDCGIIKPSSSKVYCTESTFPRKKDMNGLWLDKRHCLDFRPINSNTVFDPYPLPRWEELVDAMGDSAVFTKLDLKSGFHQIPLKPEDQEKTTFRWRNELWQYTRMPFGLKNACTHFMRVMDHEIRRHKLEGFVVCYVDDVIVHSRTAGEHLQHVDALLNMLQATGLKAHPSKCVFGADCVEFLGHNVSRHGMTPAAAKVQAINDMPHPGNVAALRSALGLFNYYRCYVENYSEIAAPLNALLQKNVTWSWTSVHRAAYQRLKTELADSTKAIRRPDFTRPFVLHTDFSNYGCGAVLGQVDDKGQEYMVACASRSLNKYERHYCSFQGEMLAAVWAVRLFRYYLQARSFQLVTSPAVGMVGGQR
jgi:hypothetical protein